MYVRVYVCMYASCMYYVCMHASVYACVYVCMPIAAAAWATAAARPTAACRPRSGGTIGVAGCIYGTNDNIWFGRRLGPDSDPVAAKARRLPPPYHYHNTVLPSPPYYLLTYLLTDLPAGSDPLATGAVSVQCLVGVATGAVRVGMHRRHRYRHASNASAPWI